MIEGLWSQVQHFLQQGGSILWAILLVALMIFAISTERALYVLFGYPRQSKQWLQQWQSFTNNQSWMALRIRQAILASSQIELNRALWLLKSCVVVCPLLGLTGTVAGMISVFEELSFTGNGNPRLLSSGIFQATIPTMAGMLIGIIGMILRQQILRLTQKRQRSFAHSMSIEHQEEKP
ncbi:MAG: MotA/TolQ/ExbB proton channel family protein [Hahellaceae bacterium]|nr:MotA/TolQ/ExbB proton channel family protein [Hahellaceae bacterium]MCP5211475.1 MotA/TolQ/ExbB proton channel family protein [Hahellaceae bacterium]